MNVYLAMEDVTSRVLITMGHLNAPVLLDICLKLITLTVMVAKNVINVSKTKFLISDVDECQINNGGCNQTCTNTYGSFQCSCGLGYILATDSLDCDGKHSILIFNKN